MGIDVEKISEKVLKLEKKLGDYKPVNMSNIEHITREWTKKESAFKAGKKCEFFSRKIYDKNGEDYKILFKDIRKIENVSELYKLRAEYKDVIDASRTLGEGGDDRLVGIMYHILLKKEYNNASLLNEFRKYIEDFIMKKWQILYYWEIKKL